MSNLICPDCGSDNIITERRPDGFHICRKCSFYWRNNETLKQTLFDRITQSEETLAEEFVGMMYDRVSCEDRYYSMLIGEFYNDYAEAIAATVAKLKEVAE